MWLTYVGVKGEIVWPMVEPRAKMQGSVFAAVVPSPFGMHINATPLLKGPF